MLPLRDDEGGKRYISSLGNAGRKKKQNEGIGITLVPIDFFGVEAGCFGVLKSTVNASKVENVNQDGGISGNVSLFGRKRTYKN